MNEFIPWEPFENYEESQFSQFVMEHYTRVLSVLKQLTSDEALAETRAAEIVVGHFFSDIPENMSYREAFDLWRSLPDKRDLICN